MSKKKSIIVYIISILILFLLLYASTFIIDKKEKVSSNNTQFIKILKINESKDNYTIDVSYPRFNQLNVDKIITDYIYSYVSDFKKSSGKLKNINSLIINYSIFSKDNYINIFFDILSSINGESYKNILIDTTENKEIHIEQIYDVKELQTQIKDKIEKKYSKNVYSSIDLNNLNKYTYYFDDNTLDIYFDEINYNNESYIPTISLKENDTLDVNKEYDKYVAFTFDDGPSENTLDILYVLNSYNYSATFFMLGNRMKYNENVVKKVCDSTCEIGTHSYSHKNLAYLNKNDIFSEINSSQIIYNSITSKNIIYFRPPYGSYNSLVAKTVNMPIILWSIDPKDWLSRDAQAVSDHILNYIYDGSIVLLHDVYPSTVEAIKILFPILDSMGYKVVSISQLSKIKNISLENAKVYREIK